jgi:hypothetical protein
MATEQGLASLKIIFFLLTINKDNNIQGRVKMQLEMWHYVGNRILQDSQMPSKSLIFPPNHHLTLIINYLVK